MRHRRYAHPAVEGDILKAPLPAAWNGDAFPPEAIEMHHRSPWSLSSVLVVRDFEDLEPIISFIVLVVVVLVWCRAQSTEGPPPETKSGKGRTFASPSDAAEREEAPPQQSGRPRKSLVWLRALALASIGLLVLQGSLGIMSGSLTLLADMGHAAGDTITYFAAYVVEKVKHDLTTRKGATGSAAWIDTVAGIAATLLVAGVSINAMVDAIHRLRSKAPEREGENVGLIGPAILTFAIVSLVVNLALLAFRVHESKDGKPEVPQASPAASPLVEPPPPPPAAHTTQRRPRALRTAGRAAGFAGQAGVPNLEAPPPPPPPVPSMDADPAMVPNIEEAAPPPPPPPQVPAMDGPPPPWQKQQRGLAANASSTKWLHAAFHPGCDGCDDEACPSDDTEAAPPGEASPAQKGKEAEKNLNLYGATLHLITDVVRSIIVGVTGLLLRAGILTDVARTDALCAIVVGLCVLLGSAAFFYAPIVKLLSKHSAAAEAGPEV